MIDLSSALLGMRGREGNFFCRILIKRIPRSLLRGHDNMIA